jgi:hypothetical protein
MTIYSRGFHSSPDAPNAAGTFFPVMDIQAAATNRPAVLEICIMLTLDISQQLVFQLARPTNTSVQSGPMTLASEDLLNGPSVTTVAVEWTTAPLPPTNAALRRYRHPAITGSGVLWNFWRGLVIPASSSLAVWVQAIGGVSIPASYDCYAVVNE